MEITFDNRLRRMEQLVRPDGTKKETAADAGQPVTDALSPSSLSQKTIEKLKEQGQRLKELLAQQAQQPEKPALWELDETEKGEDESGILEEGLKAMRKCQEIASRIMRGDRVPPQDEAYLREHDPDGYKLALVMRQPKEDPEEWESVLDEEEASSESTGGESSGTSSSCGTGGGSSDAGVSGGDAAPDSAE